MASAAQTSGIGAGTRAKISGIALGHIARAAARNNGGISISS